MVVIGLAGCSSSPPTVVPALVAPEQRPLVWFRGEVRNSAVPWSQELTLSRALVAAQYTGLWNPHSISIVRAGQAYKVNPRDLLDGRDDPLVEPGDLIVIER